MWGKNRTMDNGKRVGVMYDRALPPQGLAKFARAAEASGTDEVWVVEDLGYAGSISAATAALAATSRIVVGIGVAPAPFRNPALLAMELASVAQMFPRRLIAGLGHGVTEWMARAGASPSSPLALLEETVAAVRALLHGETVTLHGREVHLDGSLTVFTHLLADGHGAGRPALDDALAGQAAWLERAPERLFSASGPGGAAAQAAARVRDLWTAGADSVVLRPVGPDPIGQITATLRELR
jgi:alkanesulfonate monooxygenase SsuD/methylene tetrahydromethanopterin reductase-like flavin-dependent oxidoreductase (luciferase family)